MRRIHGSWLCEPGRKVYDHGRLLLHGENLENLEGRGLGRNGLDEKRKRGRQSRCPFDELGNGNDGESESGNGNVLGGDENDEGDYGISNVDEFATRVV